jgi:salicylate hydroxylase
MAGKDERQFIIVGGGIGGLAAALALARKGFTTRVLEQTPEFREVGAGIQMGPNVFRALRMLGLRDRILADAWQPTGLEMRCALDAHRVTQFPVNNGRFLERFGEPYAVTHRADLLQGILEGCQADKRIVLENNRKVIAHEETADGVAVTLESGERIEGRALIGCDGLWSRIREDIVGDGKPRVSGHIAYRAVLPRAEVPDDLWSPDVILWAGPKTHLVQYPLRRGELFNLVAVFHSDRYEEGWNAEGDIGELMTRFAGQRPEVKRLLDKIETWRMWVLCDREPVKTWSKGRVVLLGDAAHPMLQYLAQGACMAVEDAVQLGQAVAAQPNDLPRAFEAYTQARYLRTARVQIMARVYGDFYHARGPAAELRDMVLNSRTPEQAYDSSAWLYGGGIAAEAQ